MKQGLVQATTERAAPAIGHPRLEQGKCPCCGQTVVGLTEEQEAVVRLRHFAMDGLGPTQARTLQYLIDHKHEWSPRAKIISYVYADDIDGGPETAENVILVILCKVRKKVEERGWRIENKHTWGYRLKWSPRA